MGLLEQGAEDADQPSMAASENDDGAGIAGASAMREYRRRRDAREQRARERFGCLGVALARITGDPASTEAWRKGAAGEVKVAARLAKLLEGSGVRLLHDRRAPGRKRANIDHLAIGPGGVTVIDAKMLRGRVRVESIGGLFSARRRRLLVNRRDCTALVEGVQRQVEAVRALLARHGSAATDVRGALCFAKADGLPLFRRLEVDGVVIDGPRMIAKIARRPGTLDDDEVRRLTEALDSALSAA